jgi:hypothetical protein
MICFYFLIMLQPLIDNPSLLSKSKTSFNSWNYLPPAEPVLSSMRYAFQKQFILTSLLRLCVVYHNHKILLNEHLSIAVFKTLNFKNGILYYRLHLP